MRRTFLVLTAMAACVASSCGDDADQGSGTPPHDNVVTSGIADPSARQLEMISDGEVSFDEYEEAYLTYIQCVLDEGIRLREQPHLDVHGQYYEASFFLGSPAEYEANIRRVTVCEDRHLLSVLRLWSIANRPSESLLQEASQAVVECLDEEAIKMPSHLTIDEFGALLEAAATGESGLIPAHLSMADIEPVLAQGPDAPSLFRAFLACREEVAQQYPVGW